MQNTDLYELNSSKTAREISSAYRRDQYKTNKKVREKKLLMDKIWRRKTGEVPYTNKKTEAQMIQEFLDKKEIV